MKTWVFPFPGTVSYQTYTSLVAFCLQIKLRVELCELP